MLKQDRSKRGITSVHLKEKARSIENCVWTRRKTGIGPDCGGGKRRKRKTVTVETTHVGSKQVVINEGGGNKEKEGVKWPKGRGGERPVLWGKVTNHVVKVKITNYSKKKLC